MNERDIFMNGPEDPSPEELKRYIDEACGDNPILRKKVEALYAAVTDATSFMDTPPQVIEERPPTGESEGSVIGHYELLEEIGEGGFGIVYRADQLEPVRRQVALKIIKLRKASRQVVARFEAERQALAMMDHPNIAKIFDAGTTDRGRPFFVMELVSGIAISRFCAEERLTVDDRLRLFIEVCKGVQHAHQKGIIHRDLKPSNVLVALHDGTPIPQVIDFGVAKAVDHSDVDDLTLTLEGQTVGTPAYMSPEQASGESQDIDTRSDVYSLGVMLYELLTGRLPFDPNTSFNEIRRQIKEDTPRRPSTRISAIAEDELGKLAEEFQVEPKRLHSTVRGDLDWIIMKALEKDRNRRYDSANSLLEDLERYLSHEPVLASPPGLAYEASKFISRHRASVVAGAAGFLLLLSIIGLGLYHAHRETLEELDRFTSLEKDLEGLRLEPTAGRRDLGLAKVAEAAQLNPSVGIRDNAITCLTLLDIKTKPSAAWKGIPAGSHAISFDQDLLRYAICDQEGTISIRETGTASEVSRLPGHFNNVEHLLLGTDGNLLAVWLAPPGNGGGERGQLEIWNPSAGQPIAKVPVGAKPGIIDFSPDGQWFAYGVDEHSIAVRNLADTTRGYLHDLGHTLKRIRFQPTGKLLAIESSRRLNLTFLNWRTGEKSEVHFAAQLNDFAWHPAGDRLCVSPQDSPLFLCAQESDGSFRGSTMLALNAIGVHKVAFSADGSFLVTCDTENVLKLWDPTTGEEIVELPVPTEEEFTALQVSSDNRRLGWSRSETSTTIWELASDSDVYVLPPATNPDYRNTQPLFDPTGRVLFLTSNTGVRLFDWKNRRYIGALELGEVDSIAWSPSNDNLIVVGNLTRGMRIQMIWNGHNLIPGALRFFDTPPVPRGAALGSAENLLSIATDEALLTFDPTDFLQSMDDWDTQGRTVVAVATCQLPRRQCIAVVNTTDSVLQILDRRDASWIEVKRLPLPGGKSVAFSQDGQVLFAGSDQGYVAYDTSDWKKLAYFPSGSYLSSAPIAIDPTGTFAAIGASRDSVALLRMSSMKVVAHIPLRAGEPAAGLAFSPSGAELAIAGRSQRAEVWDLAAIDNRLHDYGLNWNHGLASTNDDHSPVNWSGLGNVFKKKTWKHFRDLEEIIVNAGTPASHRGDSYRHLREFARAETVYLDTLKAQPSNPNLLCLLALSCLAQNRIDQTINYWKKATDIESDFWAAKPRLAQLYLLGPVDVRNESLGHKMALELRASAPPDKYADSFEYHRQFALASSHFRKGNYEWAMEAIHAAVRVGARTQKSMCDLFYLMAMCGFHLNELEGAERVYARATERWLQDPLQHQNNAQTRSLRIEASKVLYHEIAWPKPPDTTFQP